MLPHYFLLLGYGCLMLSASLLFSRVYFIKTAKLHKGRVTAITPFKQRGLASVFSRKLEIEFDSPVGTKSTQVVENLFMTSFFRVGAEIKIALKDGYVHVAERSHLLMAPTALALAGFVLIAMVKFK